jgi:hypothetical protein
MGVLVITLFCVELLIIGLDVKNDVALSIVINQVMIRNIVTYREKLAGHKRILFILDPYKRDITLWSIVLDIFPLRSFTYCYMPHE